MIKKWCSIILLVIGFVLSVPFTAYARTFVLSETDMIINIDDDYWYVFTRSNIKDNPELDELGISYEYMYDMMYEDNIYLDAALFFEDSDAILELFIRKVDNGVIENISEQSDDEVKEMSQILADEQGTSDYGIYKTKYKFAQMEYNTNGYYIMEFITVMNGDSYALTFQMGEPFTDMEYQEMYNIVDSIDFNVEAVVVNEKEEGSLLERFAVGAMTALIVSGGGIIVQKRKEKKNKKNANKVNIEVASLKMMMLATNAANDLQYFSDIDKMRSTAVNMGYFYGFLKDQLIRVIGPDTAADIISHSIVHLESATKEETGYEGFTNVIVKVMSGVQENLEFTKKSTKNLFMGMSVFYMMDLSNSNVIDVSKQDASEQNMRMLYEKASEAAKNIR